MGKKALLYSAALASAVLLTVVFGDLETVLQRCCSSGEDWAVNHTTCTGPSDMANVQVPDRLHCLTALYICCIRTYRKTNCEAGKHAARTRTQCTLQPGVGGETFKDCCDSCTLGMQAESMQMPCTFSRFSFGSPWDESFRDCCRNPHSPLGTSPQVAGTGCAARNPCSQICEDVGNQVRCSCHVGYKLAQDHTSCEDVDECAVASPCNPSTEICINLVGGFQCEERMSPKTAQCPPGYAFNPEKRTCDDVDECSEGTDSCDRTSQICQNSHGHYQCLDKPSSRTKKCPAGFKWNDLNVVCEDVDECEEDLDDCRDPEEKCRNTMGGYECDPKCPLHQRYDSQKNECTEVIAEAINCAAGLHNCKPEEVCIDTAAGAQCVQKATGKSCLPGFKPTAAPDGVTQICIDVDECEEFSDVCDDSEICRNEEGSYDCQPIQQQEQLCAKGLQFDRSVRQCIDVDECSQRLDNCDRNIQNCVNSNGSFECVAKGQQTRQCPPGYRPNLGGGCDDINECLEGRHKCLPGKEQCQNVDGAYRCQQLTPPRTCPTGRRFDDNTGSCEDVDECSENSHNCDPGTQYCVNAVGSYRCATKITCPHGYRWNSPRRRCDDVNECLEGGHDCDLRTQMCINTQGSYQCQTRPGQHTITKCGTGFIYDAPRDTCADINECDLLRPCQSDQTCENTVGSYKCICHQGFTLDTITRECKDINECQLHLHSCVESQRCDNTIGSYTCVRYTSCGTGYTLNAATNHCEDDDECLLGHHNCGAGFVCRNTLGSFRCDRIKCPVGQKLLTDGSCKVIVCGVGMEHDDDGNCVDINECAREQVCRLNQRCINTVNSYRCQNLLSCGAGYELNEVGDQCVDVDECARRIAECDPNQTCRNRQGGYVCECPRGYSLNSQRTCEDVDECVRFRGQICASNSECINTQGSYTCNCKDGFRAGGTDKSCLDIDECEESPNICQQTCINVWGSYQCSCKLGYTLAADQRSCQDINECEVYGGQGQLCIGFCVNEPGSFKCSCPNGYRLSSDGRTCQDIDECQEQNICNDDTAVCLNTRGGYKCNQINCPPNYVRDKDHRNRCRRPSKECLQGSSDCLKEPLSYSYNYITFVSNLRLPLSRQLDLFTMRGPRFQSTTVQFAMELKDARAPQGTVPVTKDFFHLRRTNYNEAMISLTKSIQGPQEIELDLIMKIYHNGLYGGSAIAKVVIFVVEYEF